MANVSDIYGNNYAVDKKGKKIVAFKDGDYPIDGFSNGYVVVNISDKYGNSVSNYVDKKGDYLLKKNIAKAYPFSNGLAKTLARGSVTVKSKFQYIDTKGKVVYQVMHNKLSSQK